MSGAATLRPSGSLRWQRVRIYYEKHPLQLTVVLCITIGSPFLGLLVAGVIGAAVGLALGIAAFIIGIYAVTKVREIREGGSDS